MHPISKQWTRIIPVRIYEQFVEIRINSSDPLAPLLRGVDVHQVIYLINDVKAPTPSGDQTVAEAISMELRVV